jgi:hypothetical protein
MRQSIEINKCAALVDFIQVQRYVHKPPVGDFLFIAYDLSNELIRKIKALGKITQAKHSHALVCH